ncbi:amino acid ABC transporter permease [Azohydromonas lata]|uniref:Amino acid ABC transporter permease n=1 Tax=Azohydromonas lata TaxID=45677 RepID=A0ABU5IFZ9_9BURK|nr:amino acid ABC transporter permease [Azohydromonas lata]MDZ5458038.1 amino acid ABC transporter permease [Azohydromonas lata]
MLDLIHDFGLYFLIGQYPNGPLGGLALTVLLSALALLAATPLGLALALARASRRRMLRWPVAALITVVRALPLLMVVFWAYFFLPALTGQRTGQFGIMLMALVLFDAVYLAEIVRAGLRSVPRGQHDAARALGMSEAATLRWVVLPQALRAVLPSLVNQFVATIKATSLGYIIGLGEFSFVATQVNTLVFTRAAEVYTLLALGYFVLCFGLSRLAMALERRLSRRSVADKGHGARANAVAHLEAAV